MSFFRKGDSSSSESEDESEDAQDVSGPATRDVVLPNADAGARRDMLTHALLEHFYLTQVLDEQGEDRQITPNVRREARQRYQAASARLAPYVDDAFNVDAHRSTRQDVRTMLSRLGVNESGIQQPLLPMQQALARPSLPAPLRRLLTDDPTRSTNVLQREGLFRWRDSQIVTSRLHNRYSKDFEEIGLLGKGGFGQVSSAPYSRVTLSSGDIRRNIYRSVKLALSVALARPLNDGTTAVQLCLPSSQHLQNASPARCCSTNRIDSLLTLTHPRRLADCSRCSM